MIIEIDTYNRINVGEDCFALMKKKVSKKEKTGFIWIEYKWFSSLEHCIRDLAQNRISKEDRVVSLAEFIESYRNTLQELKITVTA